MFSGNEELEMIENMSHMSSPYYATIRLSFKASLDDVEDECDSIRIASKAGWQEWLDYMAQNESQGKRILNSYTAFAPLSPAIHHDFMNKWMHRSSTDARNGFISSSSSPLSKEYWHIEPAKTSSSNPTIFPDEFVLSHVPIFLIRHPVLAFPSTLRVGPRHMGMTGGMVDDFMGFVLHYRWHVILFDWYKDQHVSREANPEPLILDADKLMYDKDAVAELAQKAGLDPAKTKYEWAATQDKDSYAGESIFQQTLALSQSIIPGKDSSGVNIEEEMVKWIDEWGKERAELLRKLVDDAMPDYLYLLERSIGHR